MGCAMRRNSVMRNNRWVAVGALFVFIAGAGQTAHAFKLKTHIAVANEALGAIKTSGGAPTVTVAPMGDLAIHNDEVVLALRLFPEYFRAGVTGPDTFPDLVGGQMFVHVNKGALLCEESPAAPGCETADVPMEERGFDSWRSIDYGMYQLRRALDYRRDELTGDASNARLQAIAFSYGYLTHMIGDGFAHSYVNEWVRGFSTSSTAARARCTARRPRSCNTSPSRATSTRTCRCRSTA